MGAVTSRLAHMSRSSSSVDSEKSEAFDISEDILIHILSFVPAEDLINTCTLVCRQWNSLISGHIIWKRKCQRERKTIPRLVFKSIPKNYYRSIYLKNPYGRNLVKNPSGAEGLKHWHIRHNDGEGWLVEDKPAGSDPVPDEAGSPSCFATSYGMCEKYQMISLLNEGVDEEILDKVRPDIAVGEWHASRFDCGTLYNFRVLLEDADHSEIDEFNYGPVKEEQWAGRVWAKTEYVFSDYPPGVRYIIFEHSGRDTQFWAGHYGCKIAGSFVKFVFKT